MKTNEMIYDGKTKQVFATDYPNLVVMSFKDDVYDFAGNSSVGAEGIGAAANQINNILLPLLEAGGVPTHFVKAVSENEALVKKAVVIPLKVLIRNVAAGAFANDFGVEEGTLLKQPSLEFCYKNPQANRPMINNYHIVSLGIASVERIDAITKYAFKVNEILASYFWKLGIKLVDFSIEFGVTNEGEIVLIDDISPDNCRLWDVETDEKLGKEGFFVDENEAVGVNSYEEILARMQNA